MVEDNYANQELSEEHENQSGVFKKIFVSFLIVFALFCVLIFGSMVYFAKKMKTEYKTFNNSQITEVENNLKISLDDNVTLEKYLREVAAGDVFCQLWFEVEDYNYFMENCIYSEYELRGLNNFPQSELYTYDENMNNKYVAYYEYYPKFEITENNHTYTRFQIYFYPKENSEYYGKIYATYA